MKVNSIIINGLEQASQVQGQDEDEHFLVRGSFRTRQATRGSAGSQRFQLADNDIMELVFEDGTTWYAGQDTLEDLYPEMVAGGLRTADEAFVIPPELSYESPDRSLAGKVALKVLNIFTRKAVDIGVDALAGRLENRQLEGRTGLFSVDPGFQLLDTLPDTGGLPCLLLIHGTASSIAGSFGDMKDGGLLDSLRETYGDRILAFQHRTLTHGPVENVRDLVKALPKNCVLHLLTTSRGGLVGEILSRFSNSAVGQAGFSPAELSILEKGYPAAYFERLKGMVGEIAEVVRGKGIVIERFIRIACPAGGTTLASKRLDISLNIVFNLLGLGTGLSANPVYAAFKNLIAAAIDTRNKPDILPGLEAQNPGSPLIKAINAIPDPMNPGLTTTIDNSLVVIAGNTQLSARLRALLIIAARLFFRRKNDLVVDTGSMSLGTRRTGRVQQFFHEEADIDHFRYFGNRTTRNAILLALQAEWGTNLPGFTEEQLSIPLAASRSALLKLDGGQLFTDKVSGNRPVAIVLPGLMGSNLTMDGELLWINHGRLISGGLKELKGTGRIQAASLVSGAYKQLVEYLLESHDVVTFPYDWRLPLEDACPTLNEKIIALLKYRQPLRIIGHSTGGVLMRDFMVTHRDTWSKLNGSDGFRLIFLGSPLGGSFRIPAIFTGMDDIITKLAMIDLVHSKKELVEIWMSFRGMLGLLPLTTVAGRDFSKRDTWEMLKTGTGVPGWPVPSAADLEWFTGYRERMASGVKDEDYRNAVYIAGRDLATPCGFRMDQLGDRQELVFLATAEGDQTVTWESGIPAAMERNGTVYHADAAHGSLANEPSLFNGIREILETGSTNLFTRTRPSVRGEERLFKSPGFRDFDLSLAGVENTMLGLASRTREEKALPHIKVRLSQGDLFYSSFPLLAGHFEQDGILYAERAIDANLDGVLSQRHRLGIYPGPIGTSEVFLSDHAGFRGAIIIGLGEPGLLTATELTRTVEQGVANYLMHLDSCARAGKIPFKGDDVIGISSLIVGCGYGGLPIEGSIKGILQGVQNANARIRSLNRTDIRTVEYVEFIEQFEDKALSSLYSLSRIEKEETRSLRIILEKRGINVLLGAKRRLPVESSEGWWNRITVSRPDSAETQAGHLRFSVSTGSSREEQKDLFTTPALIEGLIREISTQNNWSPEMAKTIFELLIPNDFKDQLKKHGNINWIVDNYTAGYPWELLQDNLTDAKPLCITAGMVRQLSTGHYRTVIRSAPENNALVIADPDTKGFAGQLPEALREGQEVSGMLTDWGMKTTSSFKQDHSDIIQKLFCDDYRIIHLAGHGFFSEDDGKGSGMLIGKDRYLTTREIRQMSTVPELVFVNCCYLGKSSGAAEELYQQRYRLAANIGTQLILNGVKCVIAAGWTVNDAAALVFANVFYRRMFDGLAFGDAVREARRSVHEKFGYTNTWGAYQCYGDPFYRLKQLETRRVRQPRTYMIAPEAEMDLDNLLSDIEIGKLPSHEYLKSLSSIIEAVDRAGIRSIGITEKEALTYLELGEYDRACDRFRELMNHEGASFSFSVAEKYFNARAKKIIGDYRDSPGNKKQYQREIAKVVHDLQNLIRVSPTARKYNILGSTYKRQGFLSGKASKLDAYVQAARSYQAGYSTFSNWYSLTNWLAFESVLVRSGLRSWDADPGSRNNPVEYKLPSVPEALGLLDREAGSITRFSDMMSYWDMLADINIRLCRYIILFPGQGPATGPDSILGEIGRLWERAGSKGKRFGEIEHLEFIIDALSVVENDDTVPLKRHLMQLQDELKKLI